MEPFYEEFQVPPLAFGFLCATGGLALMCSQLCIFQPLFSRGVGADLIGLMGLVGMFTICTVPLFENFWLVCIATRLFNLFLGLVPPSLVMLIDFSSPPRRKGLAMSYYSTSNAIGKCVGSFVSGILYDIHRTLPYAVDFWLLLICLVISVILFYKKRMLENNEFKSEQIRTDKYKLCNNDVSFCSTNDTTKNTNRNHSQPKPSIEAVWRNENPQRWFILTSIFLAYVRINNFDQTLRDHAYYQS